MATLRELLDPATAGAQLAANPPERSGVTTEQVAAEVSRNPGINADAAIGNLAGRGSSPSLDSLSRADAEQMWKSNGNNATGWTQNADGTWKAPASAGASSAGSVDRGSSDYGSQLRDRIESSFGQFKPKSEDEIIKQEMDMVQEQVNAINSVYNQKISEAERAGEGRRGSTRSLNVAGGIQFSPRGEGQLSETDAANQKIIDSINADRLAEISNLMAAARGTATKRIESQTDRFIQLADNEIAQLASSYNLSYNEANALREEVYKRAAATGYLQDGTQTLDLKKFLTESSYNDRSLQAQIDQARTAGKQVVEGADGTVMVVDKNTGTSQVIGKFAKPVAAGSGTINAADSFYDSLIADIAAGKLTAQDVLLDYGQDTATAIDKRVRERSARGENPLAPTTSGSTVTAPPPADRRYVSGVDQNLQDRLYATGATYDDIFNRLSPDTVRKVSDLNAPAF